MLFIECKSMHFELHMLIRFLRCFINVIFFIFRHVEPYSRKLSKNHLTSLVTEISVITIEKDSPCIITNTYGDLRHPLQNFFSVTYTNVFCHKLFHKIRHTSFNLLTIEWLLSKITKTKFFLLISVEFTKTCPHLENWICPETRKKKFG